MAEITVFQAVHFAEKAGELAELICPPYDIISAEERAQYLRVNPYNIIRLELPTEVGEKTTDPYTIAGDTLRKWLEDEILVQDPVAAFYLYEERFEVEGQWRSVKGLVCRVRLEEWQKGVVLPHEETLSKAKADRFNLMCATSANFSSIYSLYSDAEQAIAARIEALSAGEAAFSFTATDGVTHKVWRVTGQTDIADLTDALRDKTLYIADGHHRYETALNYRNHLRATGENTNEAHPSNFVMMTLVSLSHPGLLVFPTHRVVRALEQFDAADLLAQCARYFDVRPCEPAQFTKQLAQCAAAGKTAFGFYSKSCAALLVLRDMQIMEQLFADASPAYRALSVNVLHTLILGRLLGIDKKNMANQKNLVYTRSSEEALTTVREGAADCAFLLNPTRVDEIAEIALAGEKMPQKSTYFYPKLITGHLLSLLK